VGVQVKL